MTYFQNLVAIDAEKIFARTTELETGFREKAARKKAEWFDRERKRIVRRGIWPFRKDYLRPETEIERLYKYSADMFAGSAYYHCEKKYENEMEWVYKIWRMAKDSATPRQVFMTQTDYERMFYE